MPNTVGQRAVEFHNMAAQAHLQAAVSHDKGDHLSAHELSRQAHEHSTQAHHHSEEASKQEKK